MQDYQEAKNAAVKGFYYMALDRKKPREAVARYIGPYYVQHAPTAGDGAEPFISFAAGFSRSFPAPRFELEPDFAILPPGIMPWALRRDQGCRAP